MWTLVLFLRHAADAQAQIGTHPASVGAVEACARAVSTRLPSSLRAWPNWSVANQPLLLYSRDPAVAVWIGSAPPDGFSPLSGSRSIFEQFGASAATLAGPGAPTEPSRRSPVATVVPFVAERCVEVIFHEAFHTWQLARHARAGRFPLRADGKGEVVPDSNAATLLLEEGQALASALIDPIKLTRQRELARAAAARQARCAYVGTLECTRGTDIELLEGTAEYASLAVIVGEVAMADTVRHYLLTPAMLKVLERSYYQWLGAAWIALLRQDRPATWYDTIELSGIDGAVVLVTQSVPSKVSTLAGPTDEFGGGESARRIVRRLMSDAIRRSTADSLAFWSQQGVLIRVRWPTQAGFSKAVIPRPGGQPSIELRWQGTDRLITCTRRALLGTDSMLIIVPRDSLVLFVTKQKVSASELAQGKSGFVELTAPGINVALAGATVKGSRDSLAIAVALKPAR